MLIIAISTGVIIGCTTTGIIVRQISKSLQSPNEYNQQAAIYQQLMANEQNPLSSLHFRESYYTTRQIEKELKHQAILLEYVSREQALERKEIDLMALRNEVESKVLELKNTYLDLREIKMDIDIGRKLQEIEHRENVLEIKNLNLSNKESLFQLKEKHFEIQKDKVLLDVQERRFELTKIVFDNHKQQQNFALNAKKHLLTIQSQKQKLALDGQKQLLAVKAQKQALAKHELKLAQTSIAQEFVTKQLALNFQGEQQKLTARKLSLQRTTNANFFGNQANSLDKKRLNIDRQYWQTEKSNFLHGLKMQQYNLKAEKNKLDIQRFSLKDRQQYLRERESLNNLRFRSPKKS